LSEKGRVPSGISSNLYAMKWLSSKYAAQGKIRGAQHMNFTKGSEWALALFCETLGWMMLFLSGRMGHPF
jgi:hypothetical protein